jgi:glycosyltransferase involved in cell wall biosynthesis
MNVLHLSTSDVGGAGKAAYRLHQNLLELGLNSKMMVLNHKSGDKEIIGFNGHKQVAKFGNNISKFLLKFSSKPKYHYQNQNQSPISISDIQNKMPFKPDIIVAHWISNFITVEHLQQLSLDGVPVLWYLMDMAPFTGGCHYAWDCTGYMNQCDNCPALRSKNKDDRSYKNWKHKRDIIKNTPLTVVSATSHLTNQLKKATIFHGKRAEQIMLGIDANIFKPKPKDTAREMLNLPLKQKIIIFGTQSFKDERKGMRYLFAALMSLKKQLGKDINKVTLVTAGKTSGIESLLCENFKHIRLGSITFEADLAAAYQSAEMFVCPSIEDSGPMMINESIMCGTPVVSFKMGVASDLVITKKTGYCAQLKNSEDLARGIKYILDLSPEQAESMSKQCCDLGLRYCHHRVQAEAFNKLFKCLLNVDHK